MSVTDLNILTDAIMFAALAALGGAIVFVVVRTALRHRARLKPLEMGLSGGALLAILVAGVAMWPAARSGEGTAPSVTPSAGTAGSVQTDIPSDSVPGPRRRGHR